MRKRRMRLWQWAAHGAALTPLALLIWNFSRDDLTVNPIQAIEQRTGRVALALLVLSLSCTPFSRVWKARWALLLRRPFGLYAFMYASLHFLTFVGLDYNLDPRLLAEAIFEKRYALVGFTAFLLLIPLAITSTKGWMRRLGKRWRPLHRLVYLAAPLVVVHFLWSVKSDIRMPLLYAAAIGFLLALRLPVVRRALGPSGQPRSPRPQAGASVRRPAPAHLAVAEQQPGPGSSPPSRDSSQFPGAL